MVLFPMSLVPITLLQIFNHFLAIRKKLCDFKSKLLPIHNILKAHTDSLFIICNNQPVLIFPPSASAPVSFLPHKNPIPFQLKQRLHKEVVSVNNRRLMLFIVISPGTFLQNTVIIL